MNKEKEALKYLKKILNRYPSQPERGNMKETIWTELPANECTVLDVQRGEYTGDIVSIKIAHLMLKRPRWFIPSKRGNFYSRYTGRELDACADGIIVKNLLIDTNKIGALKSKKPVLHHPTAACWGA